MSVVINGVASGGPAVGVNGAFLAGIGTARTPLYYNVAANPANKITNPTTKAYFPQSYTFPANFLTVGMRIFLTLTGAYNLPTGTVNPTADATIEFGPSIALDSGVLTAGVGTGEYGFSGAAEFVVQSVGTTGVMTRSAPFAFQTAGGGAPLVAEEIITPATTSFAIDTTQAIVVRSGVTSTPNAPASYFRMDDYFIEYCLPPSAAA